MKSGDADRPISRDKSVLDITERRNFRNGGRGKKKLCMGRDKVAAARE